MNCGSLTVIYQESRRLIRCLYIFLEPRVARYSLRKTAKDNEKNFSAEVGIS